MAREIASGITVDEDVRFGKPVIEGTRVPVDVVLGKLGSGMSKVEVAEEYDLTVEQVLQAIQYAARIVGEEEIRALG